jgi:hypothetical protein
MKATITATIMTLLGIWLASAPAWSQRRTGPYNVSGEIQIPSQRQLEREVFTEPRNDFSSIDLVAEEQMDRMDREIDHMVDRGICNGC